MMYENSAEKNWEIIFSLDQILALYYLIIDVEKFASNIDLLLRESRGQNEESIEVENPKKYNFITQIIPYNSNTEMEM